MRPFWEVAIRPVLAAVRPRVVVEIGALQGATTTALLEELGPDAEVHVIDPRPGFDPEQHAERFGGRYRFHRDLSLNVLPGLGAADVALIDGDHNWYTVFHELEQLSKTARAAGKPLPVLLIHDVCWPYGRRDLYYDPDSVPEAFRHPYARRGMRKGVAELVPAGGVNPRLCNAMVEGGPRNGVATALDDFLGGYDRPVRRVVLPFRFGLAIVVEEARLAAQPELATLLDELEPTGRQLELLRVSEDLYLTAVTAHHGLAYAPPKPQPAQTAGRRYTDLLKQTLLNEPGLEAEAAYFLAQDALVAAGVRFDRTVAYDIRAREPEHFERVREARELGRLYDGKLTNIGFAHTMIGRARLDNVDECVTAALDARVPGDLVECGVWRGGATILMRGILAARGVSDRRVWVADSFEGLPVPEAGVDTLDLSKERFPQLAVSQERVAATFERFGLLDDQVRFLRGWFKDTLPTAPIERIAVLRLDGDLYESTMTTLDALYDKVSPGGFVIVDDYLLVEACRRAVDEFRASRGIDDPIVEIDWTGVYWRRSG